MNRGSEWHKWDLHIHTNASDGNGNCQEILEEAQKKGISCIAVTDHHTVRNVDEMKRLAMTMEISIISGVEFRTEYGKASVHLIGLFPNNYNGSVLTSDYLEENVLNPLGIARSTIIEKGREKIDKQGSEIMDDDVFFKEGMFEVQVDFKQAADIIHKYGGLVTVHAGGKANGLETEMRHEGNGPRNVSIEDSLGPLKEELFRRGYIDICEVSRPADRDFYLQTYGKPSIIASDAHKTEDVGSKFCWIKADLTFEGLRQILAEPERVSFDEPMLLQRIRKNPDKFIKSIDIKKTSNATMPERWFDNFHIDINPGLVAIIGNKGSGKSALTDIIALCSDAKNDAYSFLTTKKFRMSKPYNRARQIEATIEWMDKNYSHTKSLDSNIDSSQPERVKYIPQNFLENLCTTENDIEFAQELENIIFQHLPTTQKYDKINLDNLIGYLTEENTQACKDIQDKIKKLNASVIDKENMSKKTYLDKLENNLKYKQEQLSNAQGAKPIAVEKPNMSDDVESLERKKSLDELKKNFSDIEAQIIQKKEEQAKIYKQTQDLLIVMDRLHRLSLQVEDVLKEVYPIIEENGIQMNNVIKYSFDAQQLDEKIQSLKNEKEEIDHSLDMTNKDSLEYEKMSIHKNIVSLTQKLSEPEIKYQRYLAQKKEWEQSIAEITGTEDKEGSIMYLRAKRDYVKLRLPDELKRLKDERQQKMIELLNKKAEVLTKYRELFAPMVKFIEQYKDDLRDYPIEFDATFSIKDFDTHFFDYINQQVGGSFCGKEQGHLRINEIINNIDLSNVEEIVKFPSLINECLQLDKREGQNETYREIEDQLKKGHSRYELYDYIYNLDYLVPSFQIKMNGKGLPSLSPGERGALLLLLYLFVDMDDKPLIIDQPEENLDNESVYKYIVQFIKKAKKRRQVIMVTHNPNLAVVSDADQIIQMKIDKDNLNTVSCEAGAIENPRINKIIVDILEGTYPAFHNRDNKYFDKGV